MKQFGLVLIVLAFVGIAAVCAFVGLQAYHEHHAARPAVLNVPAGNLPAPKSFRDDWADFVALRSEIIEIQKRENLTSKLDQLNGMAARLQTQIPKGYEVDESTISFRPIVTPVGPAKEEEPVTKPVAPPVKK